jgi:alpha-ketoglutarate-dependent taurine dioxygenase
MVTETADPRAWRADTIDHPDCWYYRLSEQSLRALDQNLREWGQASHMVSELRVAEGLDAACNDDLHPVKAALEAGRGFAVITLGQPGCFSARDLQGIYWLVGQLLGRPHEQNVQGTLLYDVRDTSQDVRYGGRFSVTNAESSFHTDNSFGAEVVDYVGLLCLHPAKLGGRSQIVSAITVHKELLANHRDAWEVLRQPFHVDRRGGLRPGDEPTARFPVLSGEGPDLVVRYLRYWIETGHEKVGLPLTRAQRNALDILDQVARDGRLRVEFNLRPGEMLFINNRWILHNRTAFEDYPEPDRRRHYVRLWLRRSG